MHEFSVAERPDSLRCGAWRAEDFGRIVHAVQWRQFTTCQWTGTDDNYNISEVCQKFSAALFRLRESYPFVSVITRCCAICSTTGTAVESQKSKEYVHCTEIISSVCQLPRRDEPGISRRCSFIRQLADAQHPARGLYRVDWNTAGQHSSWYRYRPTRLCRCDADPSDITCTFHGLSRQIGLRGETDGHWLRFHDLRHSFATKFFLITTKYKHVSWFHYTKLNIW